MSVSNVTKVIPQILSTPAASASSVDGGFESILNAQFAQAPNLQQQSVSSTAPLNVFGPSIEALSRHGGTLVAQLLDEDDVDLAPVDDLETINSLDQGIDFDSAFNTEPDLDPLETSRLAVTPFQFFIDKSVDLLRKVSGMEWRSDRLMEEYARGNISIEEMTIVKAETGVAVSFAVTLVTQVTAAFNELKNMQI